MLSELALKEQVAMRKVNSDQLAVISTIASRKTNKDLNGMFEETLTGQKRKCTSWAARQRGIFK